MFVLGGVPLFPLAWLFWFIGSLCNGRLCDGKGGVVVIFLWGVLSSLAATAWTCLWDWAPWYPALASAAALVAVLFEATKEAAVLIKGGRRWPIGPIAGPASRVSSQVQQEWPAGQQCTLQ